MPHVRQPDARLSRTLENLRGRGRITEDNVGRDPARSARGAARGGRGAAGGQELHRGGQGQGAGRRSAREPHARAGVHRHPAPRAGGAHGWRRDGLQAARAAAGGGAAGGPAGRGQDHHRRQARARGSSSASASACCWSAPTFAARPPCCSWSAWPRRWARSICRAADGVAPAGHRPPGLGASQNGVVRRAHRRHRRSAARR